MSQTVHCTNCGAPTTPKPDGRTYACGYCGAEILVGVDGQQIARGLALDLHNADIFLAQLATALEHGFAAQMRVQRNGHHVVSLELTLEPHVFIATREARGVIAKHKRVSRGIALKTTTHPLDRWVALLTQAVAEHANTSARAADVLARLTGR